jgi:cell division protease FtsH
VKKLDERPQWLSSKDRPISDQPPIDFPKAPIDPGAVDGGVDSDSPTARPKRAPRPRKNPGIATA